MKSRHKLMVVAGLVIGALQLTGCASYSHVNTSLTAASRDPVAAPRSANRATLTIDGQRGNPRVLFFVSMSGGGSRSSYLSAATLLNLQQRFPIDLLAEVDVMSAVSGGAFTAAHYVASRDESVRFAPDEHQALVAEWQALRTPPVAGSPGVPAWVRKLNVRQDPAGGPGDIACTSPLDAADRAAIRSFITSPRGLSALDDVCAQQAPDHHWRQVWQPDTTRATIASNFMSTFLVDMFLPHNILRYWGSSFDRSDLMARVIGKQLLGTSPFGKRLRMRELNPSRPYLLINATNASRAPRESMIESDEMRFGSPFLFTKEDFSVQIQSDIDEFPVAHAVMASSAFPLVFPYVTLRDHNNRNNRECLDENSEIGDADDPQHCEPGSYIHVFDGGNSDNLGLKAVQRALIERHLAGQLDYDAIIVMQIDAYAKPRGANRFSSDPRTFFDRILDTDVNEAVDSLLQENRRHILDRFSRGEWRHGDLCKASTRDLPGSVCQRLAQVPGQAVSLQDRFIFYHFGFEDVEAESPEGARLKRKLDLIPTALRLKADQRHHIDQAVNLVVQPQNPCLAGITAVLRAEHPDRPLVAGVQAVCHDKDRY